MHNFCHRCGGEVSATGAYASDGHAPFCPHCGAPQLLLSDYTEPQSTGSGAEISGAGSSTGSLPPPRPNQIEWKTALRSAGLVAAVAVVLSVLASRIPSVSLVSTVWVVSASLTTLALYQRSRPLAAMNAGVGARIGVLVGVTLAFSLGAALSVGTVVARFGLHTMSTFDSDMTQAMKQQVETLSATRPIPPESLELINSLQFRTTMMLSGFAMVLGFIFILSIFGGAIGGLLRTRRRPTA
jgi:hypothetical protein